MIATGFNLVVVDLHIVEHWGSCRKSGSAESEEESKLREGEHLGKDCVGWKRRTVSER